MNVATALDPASVYERKVLLTPEGVPLHMEIASAGDRLGGFMLDAIFIFMGLVVAGFAMAGLAMVSPVVAIRRKPKPQRRQ